MNKLAIRKETTGSIEEVCARVTQLIQPAGFGILTRIDFDQKIKEKLNETISRCVILGACNPRLAYEVYQQTTEVALLIPCNIVVRELGHGKIQVEAMRPSAMLEILKGVAKSEALEKTEKDLEKAILSL